jgi:hypothetical protein
MGLCAFAQTDTEAFKSFKTVYSQGFSKDKCIKEFDFTNEDKWLISKVGKTGKSLKCIGTGSYESGYYGPNIMAFLKDYELEDFVLELDVIQNGKDYSLLDFCIFFDIKDAEHFCYAQLSNIANKKTHNLFMVNGDKPQRLGKSFEKGIVWPLNKWQHIKVVHWGSKNQIEVYMNDQLIFEANNDAFTNGHIGFGSFKSAIKVDNLKVSAPSHQINNKKFF